MAGKSTFLRQNALISILAQTGSYVPATFATLGIVDKIFSRIGSADNLFNSQSTFMVEMLETATILRSATPRSFVIMDEIGRGTAPKDGTAVAAAVLKHLVERAKCRTLFATHFHELADMVGDDRRVATWCSDVRELKDGGWAFVHKLRRGVNRESHALRVARMAGMPLEVLKDAEDLLRRDKERGEMQAEKERGDEERERERDERERELRRKLRREEEQRMELERERNTLEKKEMAKRQRKRVEGEKAAQEKAAQEQSAMEKSALEQAASEKPPVTDAIPAAAIPEAIEAGETVLEAADATLEATAADIQEAELAAALEPSEPVRGDLKLLKLDEKPRIKILERSKRNLELEERQEGLGILRAAREKEEMAKRQRQRVNMEKAAQEKAAQEQAAMEKSALEQAASEKPPVTDAIPAAAISEAVEAEETVLEAADATLEAAAADIQEAQLAAALELSEPVRGDLKLLKLDEKPRIKILERSKRNLELEERREALEILRAAREKEEMVVERRRKRVEVVEVVREGEEVVNV
jgi:hypothetical protein